MPTLEEKDQRIRAAIDNLEPILNDEKRWANECESAFSEFRVATVHLAKERDTLDALEKKDVVWKYVCRLSKCRKPYWVRCEEVINILMGSDAWMKAFVPDDDVQVDFLPTNIQGKFIQRQEQVGAVKPRPHVRLVIIGCNAVAKRHVSAIARFNTEAHYDVVRIVGLCDQDADRLAAVRALLPADSDVTTVASVELLSIEFHAIAFCSFEGRESLIPKLLNDKRYVFVESPLALSFDLTQRLAKDLNAQQQLFVAESSEFWPGLTEVQEFMSPQSGKIGELVSLECIAAVDGSFAEAVCAQQCGAAVVPGLHWVRALQKLAGPVQQAFAAEPRSIRSRKEGEGFAAATLCHEFGHVSTMHCRQYLQRPAPSRPSLIVSGTLGEISVEGGIVALGNGNADGKLVREKSGGYSSGSRAYKSASAPKANDGADPSGEAQLWKGFSDFVLASQDGSASTLPENVRNSIQLHLKDWAVVLAMASSQESCRYECVKF